MQIIHFNLEKHKMLLKKIHQPTNHIEAKHTQNGGVGVGWEGNE